MTAVRRMSVIVPVYNQADHIERVLQEYLDVLAQAPVETELIAVVNGSRDQSLEICRAVATRNPALRVLSIDAPGWGNAVRAGLSAAGGDLICYTNSARTSAVDLLTFIRYGVANPTSVIKAVRKIRDSWQRRVGSLLFNLECRALFDLFYWDINGTPKVFPREFDKLLTLQRGDDLIDVEFAVRCQGERYPMLEVPMFSSSRHGGRSTTSYAAAVRLYFRAFRMAREWREKE
jgi:glycosyltransferase involved in cell wall biosynthesis